ncbi:S9 family peptidase [Dyadobacter flavalbus]|uniref:Proline-specific endopeptidase n=2 Tax=Dyadobacter flavalbus TaxID=2579942 RepID=A0A5M8QRA9_9BACT|nr:S9 family peptidase [Dyadobacter flavalbus]
MQQSNYPPPPTVTSKPQTFTEHGYSRVDNYFWLKDKTNPEVINYLKAENTYTDTVLAHTKALQDRLFAELKGRIKEEDESVPTLNNGYYYYSRDQKGKQYSIFCRKKGALTAPEEVLLDCNKVSEGKSAFIFAGYQISDDNNIFAYASNFTGSYAEFTLKFIDLRTGKPLPDVVDKVVGFAWSADNKTFFYTTYTPALRPYRVMRQQLGAKAPASLVYEEENELFNVYVSRSKSKKLIYVTTESFTSSETRLLPADQPTTTPVIFLPRQKDIQYNLNDHPDHFFLMWKDPRNKNKKVYALPKTGYQDRKTWQEVIPHNPKTLIERIDVYQTFMVIQSRSNGLVNIQVRDLQNGQTKNVDFPEPVYAASEVRLPEFDAKQIRYAYTSLNRPNSTFEYDVATGISKLLKQQEIPSGFDPDKYEVKRLWAPAKDARSGVTVKIPMAIVYKKGLDLNGQNPTLLYAYGSYGVTMDANFNRNVFSLVDRGFLYAIAQIRGGSDLGEAWYEDGKLQKKLNTFTDFIACAEHLIAEKYTNPKKLAIEGGSAGGLLMGAVTNLRPDLFQVVVAKVPFVDVINTMLDTSLPLTTQEYEQWGNPNVKADYDYIRQYSPYDNVDKKAYPNILATGGLNDSQVGFQEPTKWVAKLRSYKTDQNLVLLKTNMESGHGGATGRFDYLKEEALIYAFILDRLGLTK